MPDDYTIRVMRRDEVSLAVEWAAAEGWNPGLNDADCFLAADPEGFLLGLAGGEPVACISAVRYGRGFGFVGFYIVRPEYRGRGHGLCIWEAAMASLSGRIVGLDGVVAQQENYKKSGFEPAYRNVRYRGRCAEKADLPPGVVELSAVSMDSIVAYDAPFFPDERSGFVRSWVRQSGARALGVLSGERLCGYGVLRPCREGFKIGPLFADGPEAAETLFVALQSQGSPGEPLFLDAPEINAPAVALAGRHGMEVVFETARMYAGGIPALPVERIYGVTTFELG